MASRQAGRISAAQLRHLGIRGSTIQGWVASGYLQRTLPAVYAVGHAARSREADLWAAVLYAGPGAAISHRTAAQWRGLIDRAPRIIEVRTRRRVQSLEGVRVYSRLTPRRVRVAGVPTTVVAETMIDLAAVANVRLVRRALSQLDHRRQLDAAALAELAELAESQRGGARLLAQCLAIYQPQFAYANGPLELAFLEWCERRNVPLPVCNVWVHDVLVDAYWSEASVVVEMDGYENHSTREQRRRDHANDLKLRLKGLTVLRYDWALLEGDSDLMYEDLTAHLSTQHVK